MVNQISNSKFPNKIKAVALDVGEKRIGISISEDGVFAFPFKTVAPENLEQELVSLGRINKIIVGLPRNMDGSLGFQAEKIKSFVNDNLEKYLGKIEYIDETATSIEAEKIIRTEGKDSKKNSELIDAYAAKIILEDWLREKR